MTNDNLFAEIDEDLDRQKLEALWKKYGPALLIIALGIVVATATSAGYRSWKAGQDQTLTTALIDSTVQSKTDADKISALQQFSEAHPGSAQSDFALLQAGNLAAQKGDTQRAVQLFDAVANDRKGDDAFRQLGDLLAVQTQLDSGDPAALTKRLQSLTAEDGVWRYSALEDQAYLALRAGDKTKAKQILTDVSQDARAPRTLSARAADLLRGLD